jgi:protein-arginine kinase activator protein McsA
MEVTDITVFDAGELEEMVKNRDIRISKALVDTVLNNLKGRKRHIHALSIYVENEQTIYDITLDRQEFLTTLRENLKTLETNELFEECAEVVKAIKVLEKKELKTTKK